MGNDWMDYLREVHYKHYVDIKKEDGVKDCIYNHKGYFFSNGAANFCEHCGTPRPAEKRKLADEVNQIMQTSHSQSYVNGISPTSEYSKDIVKLCMERVFEEINEFCHIENFDYKIQWRERLKQHLKDALL